MDKRLSIVVALAGAALLSAACSKTPKPAPVEKAERSKKAPEPVGPVAGRSAFYEMYKPARSWAPDLLPLSLTAGEVHGIQNQDGKAGMWTAVFVSPSRREARTFYYAVADHEGEVHRGVTAGGAQPWSGATPKSRPFQVTEFVVNSDEAYKTALAKAGPWLKKHPGKKATITLASTARFSAPVWYVMWGDTKSGYLAFVNATTGIAMTGK